ncbi:MAG: anti-sigma factor family protein [Armatimonadota bacterium]
MREEPMECSEELISGLLDDELDPVEKRHAALHAATCPRCAQSLGQLFAMRAAVAVQIPCKIAVPRAFWKGVRERLDSVDGLVRATSLTPQRRRPLVSPALLVACVALLVGAFGLKAVLLPDRPLPDALTRLHLQASFMPGDPGLHQAVGYEVDSRWREVSSNMISMNGVMVLQTIYNVGGLAVSVFRLPANTLDVRRLAPVRAGNRMVYLGGLQNASMAAVERDRGWDVVIARSPMQDTIALALTCPRAQVQTSPY